MSQVIKQYQKDRGLKDDGIIGKKTLLDIKEFFNISDNNKLIHFMANCDHESAGFTVVEENLNYSREGLLKIFPKYFNSTTATQYARQPQKIANRAYANRMGNGNEASGDGWKFRGRGTLQLTGKYNYTLFGNYIGVDLIKNPELVATKYALDSAIFFFDNNKVWNLCTDLSDKTVITVRKKINGGTNGISDVLEKIKKYSKILST